MTYLVGCSNVARLDTVDREEESQDLEYLEQEGYKRAASKWQVNSACRSVRCCKWATSRYLRVLLCEQLTVVLLVEKFSVFYSIGRFGTVFTLAFFSVTCPKPH
jgi:hypothetical protein